MNSFQSLLEQWLSRKVPERASNFINDLSITISSDIGLKRKENQDRLATMSIGPPVSFSTPLLIVAASDGMGGMRDGGRCASICLSSFFNSMLNIRDPNLARRILKSADHANRSVFEFAGGNGGSTLSAIILDPSFQSYIINIGDSRIYSFRANGPVSRLTVDDSFEEAVGMGGRELLQFIGMGEGMEPRMIPLSGNVDSIVLSTDGVHYIDPKTFESVLMNAPDARAASDRIMALARWCGSHDNASCIAIDIPNLFKSFKETWSYGVTVWDPYGNLGMVWPRDTGARPEHEMTALPRPSADLQKTEKGNAQAKGNRSKVAYRKRKPSSIRSTNDTPPFEILVEHSPKPEDNQ